MTRKLFSGVIYSKTCVKRSLLKRPKMVFKTDYRLMQVNIIAEYSAIVLTFIKLPVVIKTFVLSRFEWPFNKDFAVPQNSFFFFFSNTITVRYYSTSKAIEFIIRSNCLIYIC